MKTRKQPEFISRNGDLSLYGQVQELLREEIASGRLKEGDLIPSEMDLASRYGVSQGTVRKAILDLTQQGLFYRRQGKGTFVVFEKANRGRFRNFRFVAGLNADLVNVNLSFVKSQVIPARGEIARYLNLNKGAKLIRLDRMGKIAHQFLIYTNSYLPKHLYKGLEKYTAEDFFKNTLWKLQEIYFGIRAGRREEFFSAISADPQMARLLEVETGHPLLRLFSFDGEVVEYRDSYCHPGNLRFYVPPVS
jgi:GntR family transcriptional regulator